MSIANNAFYSEGSRLTLKERVNDLTDFQATDNDFINHMLAEGATDVLMKVKKMNPIDFKLFTISFSSKLDEISVGGNLYYPRDHVNKGDSDFTNNFIFHPTGNTNFGSTTMYIEVKDDNPAGEVTLAAGSFLKFTSSTAFADYMSAFDGELVKIKTFNTSTDHTPSAGYTLYKAELTRGLNGDNTIISETANIIPLTCFVLRLDEFIDVQRKQTYTYEGATAYRYRFCEEASSKDRYRLSDPDSFAYATGDKPNYYRENSKLTVVPTLLANEDWVVTSGATPSYVGIDCATDNRLDNIPEKYEGAIILYAALKIVTRLYEDTIKNEEDPELGQGYAQLMQTLQVQYISALQIPPNKQDKKTIEQQGG